MNTQNIKDFIASQTFNKILYVICGCIIALLIFQAGMFVGYRKALFSYQWGDNFHNTFGGGRDGKMGMMGGIPLDPRFAGAHGATGKIITVGQSSIIIESPDGIETTVDIATSTIIRKFRDTVSPQNLQANDIVVVIGTPNSAGVIDAKLIRIMPANPMMNPFGATSTSNRD